MSSPSEIVFLFDVDNTLLDNDKIEIDIRRHMERKFGKESLDRYYAILKEWVEIMKALGDKWPVIEDNIKNAVSV
jgi:hypothetical protein